MTAQVVPLSNLSPASPVDAMKAVASNLLYLSQDERERVLLAVATLYGIIRPTDPPPIHQTAQRARAHVKRSTSTSIRARVLERIHALEGHDTVEAVGLADELGVRIDTLRSVFSKLLAVGEIVRVGHGLYRRPVPSRGTPT